MLMVSASMLLTGSMLDNHLFNIYPGLYYTVALVIACLLYEQQFSKKEVKAIAEETVEENLDTESEMTPEQSSEFIENISELLEESKEILNS